MNAKDRYRDELESNARKIGTALATVTAEQRLAAEQRVAAEKLAEDARRLEQSLAAEAQRARHVAAYRAQALRLQQAAELEAEAVERARECTAKQKRNAADRAAAEAYKSTCDSAHESAVAEVAMRKALLVQARQKLEQAKAAGVGAAEGESDAMSAEDAARVEASESARLLNEHRAARESLEEELRPILERFKAVKHVQPPVATSGQPTSSSEPRGGELSMNGRCGRSLKAGGMLAGAGCALVAALVLMHSPVWTAIIPHSRPNPVVAAAARPFVASAHPSHQRRAAHLSHNKPGHARVAASPHVLGSTSHVEQVAPPPAILLLSVLPRKVLAGKTATLCVSAEHAQRLFITGLGAFNPNLTTCRTLSPKKTTTFIAYAVNARGQRKKRKTTVIVKQTALAEKRHTPRQFFVARNTKSHTETSLR